MPVIIDHRSSSTSDLLNIKFYLPPTFASSFTSSMSGFQQTFNSVPVQSFPTQQAFLPPDHSLHQGTDPNSPELFKQNIQLVQENVVRLQELARRVSAGMYVSIHAVIFMNDSSQRGFVSLAVNTRIIRGIVLLKQKVRSQSVFSTLHFHLQEQQISTRSSRRCK